MATKHCCDSMKGELERTCTMHEDRWDCGDNVVHFNEEKGTYGLMIRDGGRSTYAMRFCPWCGVNLESFRVNVKLYIEGVQVGVVESWKPSESKQYENIHEIGKPTTFTGRKGDIVGEDHGMTGTLVTGVDLATPGSEYTVESEGYLDENGKLIITSRKVTYPKGGPLEVEELDVKFSPSVFMLKDGECSCPCSQGRDGSVQKHHSPSCPIPLSEVHAAFEKVEASEKNAKRVLGVLAALDEEDKKT